MCSVEAQVEEARPGSWRGGTDPNGGGAADLHHWGWRGGEIGEGALGMVVVAVARKRLHELDWRRAAMGRGCWVEGKRDSHEFGR